MDLGKPEPDAVNSSSSCVSLNSFNDYNTIKLSTDGRCDDAADNVESSINSEHDEFRIEHIFDVAHDDYEYDLQSKPFNDVSDDDPHNSGSVEIPTCRSIVEMPHIFNEIMRICDEHSKNNECKAMNLTITSTRRMGLLTLFHVTCFKCNFNNSFWSESTNESELDVNYAAVASSVFVGIGHQQMEEFFGSMNIRCMTKKVYMKKESELTPEFEKAAVACTKIACIEEGAIARENGNVIDDKALVDVVGDGQWGRRSYGTNMDSFSGSAALIGSETRQVLYYGVRNKFCQICDQASKRGLKKPPQHTCYKNHEHVASSSSMETDIIIQGFSESVPKHGLIYRAYIGDNDSSVYKSIIDSRPYREYGIIPRKIQCSNHLLRAFCKKIQNVIRTTQKRGQKRKKGFVQTRAIVKKKYFALRQEIVNVVARRREQDHCSDDMRATELQKDLLNVPSHIFGQHARCQQRGYKDCRVGETDEKNYVPFLKVFGLYSPIEIAIKYLSCYSDSLLLGKTNNLSEQFNAQICKVLGGKRVFHSRRWSFNARIAAAVLTFNTQKGMIELLRSMEKNVPPALETVLENRLRNVQSTKLHRATYGRKPRRIGSAPDEFYGENSKKPDQEPRVFETLFEIHKEKLREKIINRDSIEENTRGQKENPAWRAEKQDMLTASNFGEICRRKKTTLSAPLVKRILFPQPLDLPALKYGCDNEAKARQQLQVALGKPIRECGLFVHNDYAFLGASPDGLIDDDGVVEIKCPYSAEGLTVDEAIAKVRAVSSVFDKNNKERMNVMHKFYYQIQGQMQCANRNYCVFAVWTPKDFKYIFVQRDDNFWTTKMKPFLIDFYWNCMVPEIIDSRAIRRMPLREPQSILEAHEEWKKNCEKKASKRSNATKKFAKRLKKENNLEEELSKLNMDNSNIDLDIEIVSEGVIECSQEEKEEVRRTLTVLAPLPDIQNNILNVESRLSDESLDRFLYVIRKTTNFETHSVQYIVRIDCLLPFKGKKTVQIIGGNHIDHWRCYYYSHPNLFIYDSAYSLTYQNLPDIEKHYISQRFPTLLHENVICPEVQRQVDAFSCGVMAAAYVATIICDGDPCNTQYTMSVKRLRQHLWKILLDEKVQLFPAN